MRVETGQQRREEVVEPGDLPDGFREVPVAIFVVSLTGLPSAHRFPRLGRKSRPSFDEANRAASGVSQSAIVPVFGTDRDARICAGQNPFAS